jgi:hypothetical protein
VASEGWVNRLVHWLLVLGFKVFWDASSSDLLIGFVFQPRKLSGQNKTSASLPPASFPNSVWERRRLGNSVSFPQTSKQSFAVKCVPKQSLGTRNGNARTRLYFFGGLDRAIWPCQPTRRLKHSSTCSLLDHSPRRWARNRRTMCVLFYAICPYTSR